MSAPTITSIDVGTSLGLVARDRIVVEGTYDGQPRRLLVRRVDGTTLTTWPDTWLRRIWLPIVLLCERMRGKP